MPDTNLIQHHFQTSAASILDNLSLESQIKQATELIYDCFEKGGKLMICGNGGSASDAQHLSGELLNRYRRERRELPGIALTADTATITAIGNDYDFNEIFAKQVKALANDNDLLMVMRHLQVTTIYQRQQGQQE